VLARRVFAPLGMRDTGFVVPRAKRDRRAALCGFDNEGRLTMLTATPGRHALEDRPDDMTFEAGGGGLWSTVDDYLTFARMLLGDSDLPALLRPETRALMTSNQLTPEQRATARISVDRSLPRATATAWASLSSSNPRRPTRCAAEVESARLAGPVRTAVGGRQIRPINRC
jgi:CubicO group peptidase (beta-lactamase class C family)